MPRTEESKRETQRAKILDAAKKVFLRKGWSTTMADVAAEAQISQGLAYRYFDGKDAIFSELIKQLVHGDTFGINEIMKCNDTSTQRLEMVISGLLKSSCKSIENFEITMQAAVEKNSSESFIDFFHKTFRNMNNGDVEAKKTTEMMRKQLHMLRDFIKGLIVEGQSTGEFVQGDPDKLTVLILSSVRGLTALSIHQPEQFKAYYPYTEGIMRLVTDSNHQAKII